MTSQNNKYLPSNWAQLLEKAHQFLDQGNETDYFHTLESAARLEHPVAEFLLGKCYLEGIGVPPDTTFATEWFRRAAEHGYIKANAFLASLFLNDRGSKAGYAEALHWLVPAVRKKEPYAQYLLGWMYQKGLGVDTDPDKGLEWLIRSADQEFPLAENELGTVYCEGIGVAVNRGLGITWYTRAAHHGFTTAYINLTWQWHKISSDEADPVKKREADEQTIYWAKKADSVGEKDARLVLALVKIYGSEELRDVENAIPDLEELANEGHPYAQSELANCYRLGIGVNKDPAKQLFWLEKAAGGGICKFAYLLGSIYQKGLYGTEKDICKARTWFEKAAEMGSVEALIRLGSLIYKNELPGDEKQAFLYFYKAAEMAVSFDTKSRAYSWLSLCYSQGFGVKKDVENVLYWGEKAAEYGGSTEQYEIALNYGYRIPQPDDKRAAYWFEQAALQGHADAQLKLGYFYHTGRGVPRDYEKALYWFRLSAEQGNPHAINNIGDAYYYGYGVEQSYEESFRWVEKAAHLSQKNAMFMMGEMLYNGKGTAQDQGIGLEWVRKAAEAGNQEAQEWLQKMRL